MSTLPETRKAPPTTLGQWLEYIEQQHPHTIALGLERVMQVKRALGLNPAFPIITVGGTNGKGSCCALLEAVLLAAGYRVGCYTSPHLQRYNERVRIAGHEANDDVLCRAFERVESARMQQASGVALTYFEYGTLAAVLAFVDASVDVAILEVGLGGRLDAVNAFDADSALIASIDIDHSEYLGGTREAIGAEKAGIFRAGRPAICADASPPSSLLAHAADVDASLQLIGRDFGYRDEGTQWQYWGTAGKRHSLPQPALRGQHQLANAAACIAVLDSLRTQLPVAAQDIRSGLLQVRAPARFQVLPGRPQVILDVAHNPHAGRALAANLDAMPAAPKGAITIAVFSMLQDKDVAGVVQALGARVTHWHVAPSTGPRGATAAELAQRLQGALAHDATTTVSIFATVAAAWQAACKQAAENDRIIVFGSFLTVAAVMAERQRSGEPVS